MKYDPNWNLRSLTGPESISSSFTTDPVGRVLTASNLAAGTTTSVTYDPDGNVLSITPPGRSAHVFGFTPDDLESSYSPPDAGILTSTTEQYDLDDQLLQRTRPDQVTIVPQYDPLSGWVTSLTAQGLGNSFTYTPQYDAQGRLAGIAAPDGELLTYGYDGSLRTKMAWSGPVAGTLTRTFNSDFRVASEQVTGAPAAAYSYDQDGLLMTVGALALQRDAATGLVTGATLGNLNESRVYTQYSEEQSYTASNSSTLLYSVAYIRDDLGRVASKSESVQGTVHVFGYTYDASNRLAAVVKDGVAAPQYTYDPNGNRLNGPGLTQAPVYDAQDRMLSYGACNYGYKPNGELLTKVCPEGTTNYDYDPFGSLHGVTLPDGSVVTYVLDGQNRRVGKKVNGILVEGFLYRNRLQPAAWLNGDGSIKATFVYGLKPNVPEYMLQGDATYRLITDQIGSVRLVVDVSTGAVIEQLDYDEFGVSGNTTRAQPFGFAGGLRDPDTELTLFGARDYDPGIGRWTIKDPLRFGGRSGNLYGYVSSDPVNRVDPSGLLVLPPPGPWYANPVVIAVVVAVVGGVAVWAWLHPDHGVTPGPDDSAYGPDGLALGPQCSGKMHGHHPWPMYLGGP